MRQLSLTARRAILSALLLLAGTAHAADVLTIEIAFVGHAKRELPPLSLVEPVLGDEGIMGARQAIGDNQTTGKFLGHDFKLNEFVAPEDAEIGPLFEEALKAGQRIFVADLTKDDLVSILPIAEQAGALLFNSRAPDDDLRTDQCSVSLMHVTPSRAMLADGLAQYLMWKRWDQWALILGSHEKDKLFAAALRRAAQRYGAEIVEERIYEDTGGARRTDSGHVQVQRQMPVFTQNLPEHDVLITADEADVFAEYLPFTTWDPRPVAGSAGLTPTSWSRVHEQWGGTQVQRRFEKFSGRWMTPRDFDAWLAVRVIGEAVTRTGSSDPKTLHDYIVSDDFEIAAFKGEGLTFRNWNQQMRQPILITTPRMLVSVSPQDQYLHQRSHLDTLGFDQPETRCNLNQE